MDTLVNCDWVKGDKSFCIDKTIIKNPWLFIKGFYDWIITDHNAVGDGNTYHRQRTCIKNRQRGG